MTNPWHMSVCAVMSVCACFSKTPQHIYCCVTVRQERVGQKCMCVSSSLQQRLHQSSVSYNHCSSSQSYEYVCAPHFNPSDPHYIVVIHPGCFVTISGSVAPCGCFFPPYNNKVLPSVIFPSHLAVDEDTTLGIHYKKQEGIFSFTMCQKKIISIELHTS